MEKVSCWLVPRNDEIYLNDAVFLRVRVQSILNVTLAHNFEMSDDVDGSRSEHVVIRIRERLRRGDDDRVASMDA